MLPSRPDATQSPSKWAVYDWLVVTGDAEDAVVDDPEEVVLVPVVLVPVVLVPVVLVPVPVPVDVVLVLVAGEVVVAALVVVVWVVAAVVFEDRESAGS